MDHLEREAVFSLVPYFDQDNRVVVDVGSNKGEWSDLLVHNVDDMFLFEPNILLYHYLMVKYDTIKTIIYRNLACGSHNDYTYFYRFKYNHSGLSSIYINERWKDYEHEEIQIPIRILDEELRYVQIPIEHDEDTEQMIMFLPDIDLIKIDVEGAEWDVIQGAENLLRENKIKFIQIEYSEHYKVPGYKFQSIIDFVKPFGYELYDYDGHWFKADFKEDYIHKNYYFMQEFTEDWNQQFRKNTKGMKFNFVLEIGCFEGLTTCHICDFLLNEGGRIICIDPLEDQYLTENLDKKAKETNKSLKQFKGQYDRFIRNTKGKPVNLERMTSDKAFEIEGFKDLRFDLIYIDGDHRGGAVYRDACNSWEVLKQGGFMLFDDYADWGNETHRGINRFLKKYQGLYETIIKDYQVMIQKNIIE